MKAYLAILKCRFSVLFQYRAAALAGLCTQLFWGLIKVMVLSAFYAESSRPQPMSLEQAITFIWLGQALIGLLPWTLDKEVEEQINTGNVAYELVRPLNLYWIWYFRSFAIRFVPTAMRFIPVFIVAGLSLGLDAPISMYAGIAFAVSLIFSVILASSITTFVMTSLLWTISGEGLKRLLPHTVVLLSGMVVPLPLFPEWIQPFLSIQPFRGVLDIPFRLYTGIIPANESLYYLAFQLIWSLLIIVAGKTLIARGINRLTIQGG
ncbi:MAG: ABC-2 family transporter protein [Parachlamydiaceae bacterium]|nr:ABC-2 family transporter protein [Parachlamydiaceae bacterium]